MKKKQPYRTYVQSLYLFTCSLCMQSDGMRSDGLLGGAPSMARGGHRNPDPKVAIETPTPKSDKNEEVHYLKVWTT